MYFMLNHEGAYMKKITLVSLNHYCKLVLRGGLFLFAIYLYITQWRSAPPFGHEIDSLFLMVVWMLGLAEILSRFFPSKLESMGCQKVFAKNYRPLTETPDNTKADIRCSVGFVAAIWIAFNCVFGFLYWKGILDTGFMYLLCLFYSVCDMICILFFCPFQSWFMKNRCCTTCRIFNWDHMMMFSPLVFVPGFFTWSLCAGAVIVLVIWEISFALHPERFYEGTNEALKCCNCTDRLCGERNCHAAIPSINNITKGI